MLDKTQYLRGYGRSLRLLWRQALLETLISCQPLQRLIRKHQPKKTKYRSTEGHRLTKPCRVCLVAGVLRATPMMVQRDTVALLQSEADLQECEVAEGDTVLPETNLAIRCHHPMLLDQCHLLAYGGIVQNLPG